MAKVKSVYVCSECGYESAKWNGKCPECGQWNTFEEREQTVSAKSSAYGSSAIRAYSDDSVLPLDKIDGESREIRYLTGLKELDRVLGGGLVKGSLVLIGGEPGIGKSTLLLQICKFLGQDKKILYVSGEESTRQIKLRADRLGVDGGDICVLSKNDAEAVSATIIKEAPDIAIIDSIQTMSLSGINSSQGSISQVRECTSLFMRTAKEQDIPIFIVGHVNKDGAIAGPKVMEHIVDAVLYFEGQQNMSYRILRAEKNRFGSTNEIGVFEMGDDGLTEVPDPSEMLLSGRPSNVSGNCVACVMEGSRPILAEVQALVAKSAFSAPRRTSSGFDYNRLYLILAVLEKRVGLFCGALDVYINVVGGMRIDDPASDLPVAMALYSSLTDKVISDRITACGEIGLGGEVRSASFVKQRISEAERLGFEKIIVPLHSLKNVDIKKYGIKVVGVSNIRQAFNEIAK